MVAHLRILFALAVLGKLNFSMLIYKVGSPSAFAHAIKGKTNLHALVYRVARLCVFFAYGAPDDMNTS
eukprot:13545068-Alexandrium_andersonii.AAC.1